MGVSDGKGRRCFVAGAVIQIHGPCGAVTGTDENGRQVAPGAPLDRVGMMEVDPQRIRGRLSVGASKPACESGQDALTGTSNCCLRFSG